MWKRLSDWFALTKTERKVFLFLGVLLLLGTGIRYYEQIYPNIPLFDYRQSDSTFIALSAAFAEMEDSEEVEAESSGLVNINTASKERLTDLAGIGPVLADRIIEFRKTHGLFQSIEDIQKVKGISKKKFEQIRNSITMESSF